MLRNKAAYALAIAAVVALGFISQAVSQETRQGGNRGQGGDFRQRMEEGMKTALGTTDDEWKALQPKLEKVMTLQREKIIGMVALPQDIGRFSPADMR